MTIWRSMRLLPRYPQSLLPVPVTVTRRTMSFFGPSSLNPHIKNVQYAVRGELALKAEKYRDMLKDPNNKLPFDRVITANIGNPQQKGLDQPPLTFGRQVRRYLSRIIFFLC